MSMLDLSPVLTDPVLLDTFEVRRRFQTLNNYGESKISIESHPGVAGVIFPEGLNDLTRRSEAEVTTKSIVVITRFALRGESETVDGLEYQPDVVFWRGNSYLIVRVEDYSNVSRGF